MKRPWAAGEIETAKAMRGQHTNREIAETLGRSTVSVSQVFKRIDAGAFAGKGYVGAAGRSPVHNSAVSHTIAQRLGVDVDARQQPRDVGERQHAKRRQIDRSADVSRHDALEPVLIVADAHRPYHSKVWWDLLMQVGRFLKPKHLVVIGDFADFYSVSDHDKDPERANRMDAELADVDEGLNDLDSLGATDKLYIEGNHEDRLRRHLMKNPALARVVSTEKLLRLKERGWEFVPYKRHAQRGAMHYTHDVGAAGRNAVFRALDTYQHSIVSGHAHRLAYIVEGNAVGDVKLSAMFGCGLDIETVDYTNLAKARKDWCLGFGVGYYDASSGFSYLVPVPVVHSTCMVNGRLFRSSVA